TVTDEFPLPSPGDPFAITLGPDQNLWFTESFATRVGRISPAGQISEFGLRELNAFFGDITAGPDGALWFIDNITIGPPNLVRITTDGNTTPRVPVPAPFGLGGLTTGPDQNIWFTEVSGNQIGQLVLGPGGSSSAPPQALHHLPVDDAASPSPT